MDSWSEPTRWSARFQHLIRVVCKRSTPSPEITGSTRAPSSKIPVLEQAHVRWDSMEPTEGTHSMARGERILTWRSKSQPTLSASRQNSSFGRKPSISSITQNSGRLLIDQSCPEPSVKSPERMTLESCSWLCAWFSNWSGGSRQSVRGNISPRTAAFPPGAGVFRFRL